MTSNPSPTDARPDHQALELSPNLARVVELQQLRRAIDAEEAVLLATIERDATCDTELGMRTPAWLAWQTRLPRCTAAARVRVANGLTRYPQFINALAAGTISWEHCRSLTANTNPRNTDALAAAADALITAATHMKFEPWDDQVRALARYADEDGAEPPEHRDRLHLRGVEDTYDLSGEYGQANGTLIAAALNHIADRLFRSYTRARELDPDLTMPSRSELLAEALLELTRLGTATPTASTQPNRPEAIIIFHPDQPSPNGLSLVTTTIGTPIHDPNIWRILTDPFLICAERDHWGRIQHQSSRRRLVSRAIRRALCLRDGGCVFPGCDAPVNWTDAHHVTHWNQGGTTTLDNTCLLCRHHHCITHRNGWTMTLDHHQHAHWTTPNGHTIHGQRHTAPATGPPGTGPPT